MNMQKQIFISFIKLTLLITTFCVLLSSCNVLQKNSKKEFNDDYYTQQIENKKQKVYISILDDTIQVYPTKILNNKLIVDTNYIVSLFQKEIKTGVNQSISFAKTSLDIDFFTIPLKFRPNTNDVPAQLNTNLNGAVYFGYRTDKYVMNYIKNPLGKLNRNINHFGFSIGAFTGLGNTFMSPTNTNNILQKEYDGIVWSKGLAGIFALNNFTMGLAFGFDNLLDNNNKIWIYQGKPWLGLAIGLNLN